ncbi:MAG TPA: sensor histidine kinase [Methanocella sp.]
MLRRQRCRKPDLEVDVRIDRTSIDGKTFLRFTFEDNGRGIPDDLKEDIFKRLQRGNTAAGGKGPGLYLVKTLVENYRGQVWAENRVAGD